MFTRSRALIFLRTQDTYGVLNALDRYLRKWDFQRLNELPLNYAGVSGQEVRALFCRGADEQCPWTTLAIEDLQNALQTAYALAKALTGVPVLASRAYKQGDWQLKVYLDKDCLLKVGDDPDHELAWLAIPLAADRFTELGQQLSATPAFPAFLESALAARPDPKSLEAGLSLRNLAIGYEEIRASENSDWEHIAFAHNSSRLVRG